MTKNHGIQLILLMVFLAGSLLPAASSAVITFERTCGGSEEDRGVSVQLTTDGGYVVAGVSRSFGAGDRDVYLVKTDSLGDLMWERTYGGTGYDFARSVVQNSDGGYAIGGYTESFGAGWGDLYFVLTDSLGSQITQKTYGGPLSDGCCALIQTPDNGYVMAGHFSSSSFDYDIYLVRMDTLGDSLWTKTFLKPDDDFASSMRQTLDHGYIIAGQTYPPSPYPFEYEVYLVKTDSLGDTLWTRTFGYDWSQDGGFSVVHSTDSGYVVAGWSEALDGAWLIKVDSLGDTLWTRAYVDFEFPNSIEQTSDGGYVIAGTRNWRGYLIKTDSLGDTLWTRRYDHRMTSAVSVKQTPDGGYIATGGNSLGGMSEYDVYLVKTDENGLVERDGGVVSIDQPSVDTVFTDSIYSIMATVQSFLHSYINCDVVTTIDSYVDTVHVLILGPDSTAQVSFEDWLVPSIDSTAYIMTVCTELPEDSDTTNDCIQKLIFAYNPVGIEETSTLNVEGLTFELLQNEPNPFHSRTVISYSLPVAGAVTLKIYDTAGRLVKTLVAEEQKAGVHRVEWSPKDKSSGIYFYRLEADEFADMKKVLLLR